MPDISELTVDQRLSLTTAARHLAIASSANFGKFSESGNGLIGGGGTGLIASSRM